MKYIALLDSEYEFTKEVIDDLKNTVFLGDNTHYEFEILSIERKVGKILINDKYRLPMYECLGCNHPVMKYWKYCPNCGNNIEEYKDE